MTTVYLIRHGQSIGNKLGRFLGQTDLDLSELLERTVVDLGLALEETEGYKSASCISRCADY